MIGDRSVPGVGVGTGMRPVADEEAATDGPTPRPQVGRSASRSRLVTGRDIELFTEISGDRNPMHDDADRACDQAPSSGTCSRWVRQRCGSPVSCSGVSRPGGPRKGACAAPIASAVRWAGPRPTVSSVGRAVGCRSRRSSCGRRVRGEDVAGAPDATSVSAAQLRVGTAQLVPEQRRNRFRTFRQPVPIMPSAIIPTRRKWTQTFPLIAWTNRARRRTLVTP